MICGVAFTWQPWSAQTCLRIKASYLGPYFVVPAGKHVKLTLSTANPAGNSIGIRIQKSSIGMP